MIEDQVVSLTRFYLLYPILYFLFLERVTGVEPVSRPWQGRIIPLYDTRMMGDSPIIETIANLSWYIKQAGFTNGP